MVAKGDLQLLFPKADSIAIASTVISEDEQSVGISVVRPVDEFVIGLWATMLKSNTCSTSHGCSNLSVSSKAKHSGQRW